MKEREFRVAVEAALKVAKTDGARELLEGVLDRVELYDDGDFDSSLDFELEYEASVFQDVPEADLLEALRAAGCYIP